MIPKKIAIPLTVIIVFLSFLFSDLTVFAYPCGPNPSNPFCWCGEANSATWTDRKILLGFGDNPGAYNCDPNFVYRGVHAEVWKDWVENEVRNFGRIYDDNMEKVGDECRAKPGGDIDAVIEAHTAMEDKEPGTTEGISCVCTPSSDICEQYFNQFISGGSGSGSTITVPPRSWSPEGTSTIKTIRTVGKEFFFELPTFGEINSFTDILGVVGKFVFNLAIPIAVILIIWSGIKMLTSAGNPNIIASAKKTLFYTLIGFAIVLIARGFFTLVKSILEIGS